MQIAASAYSCGRLFGVSESVITRSFVWRVQSRVFGGSVRVCICIFILRHVECRPRFVMWSTGVKLNVSRSKLYPTPIAQYCAGRVRSPRKDSYRYAPSSLETYVPREDSRDSRVMSATITSPPPPPPPRALTLGHGPLPCRSPRWPSRRCALCARGRGWLNHAWWRRRAATAAACASVCACGARLCLRVRACVRSCHSRGGRAYGVSFVPSAGWSSGRRWVCVCLCRVLRGVS